MAAGLTALSAVLMALIGRERSGRGDYIDCAMLDSLLPWCAHTASGAIAGGPAPVSSEQRSLGGAAFYQIYESADGRHVTLGAREEKFVHNLLTALGREDLIPVGSAPAGQQGELIDYLRGVFRQRTQAQWIEWFADKDVAFSAILDFREAFDHPHIAERGLIAIHEGSHMIAPAIRFASEDWEPRAAPELGAHS